MQELCGDKAAAASAVHGASKSSPRPAVAPAASSRPASEAVAAAVAAPAALQNLPLGDSAAAPGAREAVALPGGSPPRAAPEAREGGDTDSDADSPDTVLAKAEMKARLDAEMREMRRVKKLKKANAV